MEKIELTPNQVFGLRIVRWSVICIALLFGMVVGCVGYESHLVKGMTESGTNAMIARCAIGGGSAPMICNSLPAYGIKQ